MPQLVTELMRYILMLNFFVRNIKEPEFQFFFCHSLPYFYIYPVMYIKLRFLKDHQIHNTVLHFTAQQTQDELNIFTYFLKYSYTILGKYFITSNHKNYPKVHNWRYKFTICFKKCSNTQKLHIRVFGKVFAPTKGAIILHSL